MGLWKAVSHGNHFNFYALKGGLGGFVGSLWFKGCFISQADVQISEREYSFPL